MGFASSYPIGNKMNGYLLYNVIISVNYVLIFKFLHNMGKSATAAIRSSRCIICKQKTTIQNRESIYYRNN